MRVRCSMPVLIISMLMSGPGLADDLAQPRLTPAAEAFLADLERSSRWQLAEYSLPIRQTDGFIRPLPDVEFEELLVLVERHGHFRKEFGKRHGNGADGRQIFRWIALTPVLDQGNVRLCPGRCPHREGPPRCITQKDANYSPDQVLG